jgi:hypothetical protein
MVVSCGPAGYAEQGAPNTVQGIDQQVINIVYPALVNSTGYPVAEMRVSTERINLRERLLRFNQWNKMGYVYLFYPMGGVAGYFTIRGKVSNPDSQLTSTDQIEYRCPKATTSLSYCSWLILTSPGDDGSWGPNERGIFFFTNDDVLVETSLEYFYSDAPVKLNDQKLIVFDVKVGENPKPSSVGDPLQSRKDCAEKGINCPASGLPPQPQPTAPKK